MCADRFLEVGNARLRYRIEGAGPAVVLVHGWALDLDMWQPQFAGLRDRFMLLAIDRRGFGLSSGEPSLGRDAEDIAVLLDALGIDKVAIVGMSQGARVALDWATRFAQRTSCLVLDGPPRVDASAAATPEIPIAQYRDLIARDGVSAFRAQWLRHELTQLHTSDARTEDLLREIVGRYPGRDLQIPDDARADSAAFDPTAIEAPALVLNGEHDTQERRAAAAAIAAALRTAEHRVVEDAGHLCSLDNPRAYNLLVGEFLRRHADGATPPYPRSAELKPCSTG
jgi:pimeloyl-ACP methyl ester carboxylesterase